MINSVITSTRNEQSSQAMAAANNGSFNFNANEYLMSREPQFMVYIHSISERTYEVFRPPYFKKLILVGKKPGEKYIRCASLPHPMNVPDCNVDSSEIGIKQVDARRVAMDILNPDNLGLDQDAVILSPTSIGNNLGEKGVFWSLNEVPTHEELQKAQKRMEEYYRRLVDKANTTQAAEPGKLPDILTPEHLAAAAYLEENFGMQFVWHTRMARLEDCAICGEKAKAGVAFHRTDDGGVCVRDWARAVKAGARTRAQAFEATEDPQWAPKAPQGEPKWQPEPVKAQIKPIPEEKK